ncbi:uncharacterized protein LOC135487551 [Lineus longissimus]|uniref:uncharacterized protein LOC135487551 n=1 Tax=Lineus longissimus TaxID=88925 RepID=UPI00315CBB87
MSLSDPDPDYVEIIEPVVYKFCDIKDRMTTAWQEVFKDERDIEVHKGDIFKDGPAADAIVSPANSFGFMDGGIDMAYTRHFGWQLSERLQKVIRKDYDGEVLVGQAVIIPTFEGEPEGDDWSQYNQGQMIKYLICAPTMRVPLNVSETANAFLAFKAVILAVNKHNANLKDNQEKIRSVLCPGLGTAVGKMPADRCAYQMLTAYQMFYKGELSDLKEPSHLMHVHNHHFDMIEFKKPST